MSLYLRDPDVELHCGDALDVLRSLPARSVHMCATSPPFFGLRDYQAERQIGLENSPEEWVSRLVEVFREVREVLRNDGTLWVEIGDSYNADHKQGRSSEYLEATGGNTGLNKKNSRTHEGRTAPGCKPKDLIGAPWLLAFALRADGWYLRSEIIWAKPNPMPESVTDRPTKSHSQIFLLSKKPSYFYDQDALREPHKEQYIQNRSPDSYADSKSDEYRSDRRHSFVKNYSGTVVGNPSGVNARSVWTILTEPTPFAHFATMPQKLCQRMILAGTSERGVCPECGAPWVRVVEKGEPVLNAWSAKGAGQYDDEIGEMRRTSVEEGSTLKHVVPRKTVGWRPSCDHEYPTDAVCVPATVLDPFAGSGTTAVVARKLGRRAVLIELNPGYCQLASDRLGQQSLFAMEV